MNCGGGPSSVHSREGVGGNKENLLKSKGLVSVKDEKRGRKKRVNICNTVSGKVWLVFLGQSPVEEFCISLEWKWNALPFLVTGLEVVQGKYGFIRRGGGFRGAAAGTMSKLCILQ